jgi:hypothetical protein
LVQAREEAGDEMNDLVSAPKMVLGSFVRNWFPVDEELVSLSPRDQDKLLLQVRSKLH